MSAFFGISHHGAVNGVTGSCHELRLTNGPGLLVDCGLFQGAETSGKGANANSLAIEFPLDAVRALVVTHVHIDHVGRIPYLLAAGFAGPIYCSEPSARLLPVVLEDALKIGVTRNKALIRRVMAALKRMIKPLPYGEWKSLETKGEAALAIRLQRAGHILGSACFDLPPIISPQRRPLQAHQITVALPPQMSGILAPLNEVSGSQPPP